jgi:cytosine permease
VKAPAESRIEDFANTPVPEARTVNGWRVAMIVTGFNIALPGFLNGAQIGGALGLWPAVLVATLAGVILCATGCLTAVVSVRTRLTTYVLVQRSFGRSGAGLINVIMALVHFGWFGVNVSFFGDAMVAATRDVLASGGSFTAYVLAGGLLMAITTISGRSIASHFRRARACRDHSVVALALRGGLVVDAPTP